MRGRDRLALALFFLLTGACQDLPEIEAGICGNRVIEPPEDCDGFPIQGSECRPPGSVGECRFDCSPGPDGVRAACRPGWGCDPAGVCRRATGDFQPVPGSLSVNAELLQSGDFDGDGRADILSQEPTGILGVTRMRVHYFDAPGVPVKTWASPRVVTTPRVRDVTGDGRADLLFSDFRANVLQGEPDRSLVTLPYPSYFLPGATATVLPVLDDPIEDSAGILLAIQEEGSIGLYYREGSGGDLLSNADLGASLEELSGEPALGHVLEDEELYPCRDVAVATTGADFVTLYAPCETNPESGLVEWRSQAEERVIPLQPAAAIDDRVLLTDVDGDGHVDLMVGADEGIYVAYGDGTDLEPAHPYQGRAVEDGLPVQVPMPLAAGDLNGDGAADLVFSYAIVASATRPGDEGLFYSGLVSRFGTPWSVARVADLNGDGNLDVVAASDQALDADFYLGTGTDALNPFNIPSGAPIQTLTVADLDGDLVNDLAFVELPAGATSEGTLKVAFGNPLGRPSEPMTVTRQAKIEQLVAIYASSGRIVADLIMLYGPPGDESPPGTRLSIIEGASDRTFTCPIEISTFSADGTLSSANSLGIVTGAFVAPDQIGVISLARQGDLLASNLPDDDYGIWLLPDMKGREDPPYALGWPFGARFQPVVDVDGEPLQSVRMTAGDLDGDGIDELVIAAPSPDLDACVVSSARAELGDRPTVVASGPRLVEGPCLVDTQVAVVDVDGDGRGDVVLLNGALDGPRRLSVLWNDGGGELSVEGDTQVALSSEVPRAFSWFSDPESSSAVLVYVTDTTLRQARAVGSRGSFERSSLAAELEHATSVVAADVDGDHLPDLVVADAGALRVFRAELGP